MKKHEGKSPIYWLISDGKEFVLLIELLCVIESSSSPWP